MQLFLIRHPRPLLATGVCYGQLDVEAEDPWPLVERLRALLPDDIAVIASPSRRARAMAEALHPQPQFDRRLMEIDFGAWELSLIHISGNTPTCQRNKRAAWRGRFLHYRKA